MLYSQWKCRILFLILLFQLIPLQAYSQPTWLKSAWIEPQDSAQAINSPDEYAWRLFVALNWPAKTGTRDPNISSKLGTPGRVVWESWKLVSGGPDHSEVYRKGGAMPTGWDAPLDAYCDPANRDSAPLQQFLRQATKIKPLFEPGVVDAGVDEVRMNSPTLKFIIDNGIFNVDGQEKLFQTNVRTITFPVGSKEIKAQWREIKSSDSSRYHTCQYGGKLYGLTAIHILTKDLPNWFWATFEHVDNNNPDNYKKDGYEQWILSSRDRFACSAEPYDCNDFPHGIGLEGTKWANYRLRGTQIDFVDSTGKPTRLANSQIETGFQTSSSCITCHAKSTIGAKPTNGPGTNRLNIFEGFPVVDPRTVQIGTIGAPNPADYGIYTGATAPPKFQLTYTQLDFIWSLFRAQRVTP